MNKIVKQKCKNKNCKKIMYKLAKKNTSHHLCIGIYAYNRVYCSRNCQREAKRYVKKDELYN